MRLRRIPEFDDERMTLERLLDDAPLNTLAPAVDETDLAVTGFPGGFDVVADEGLDLARSKGMQVDRVLDRNFPAGGLVARAAHAAEYVAVTTVLMPPRTEKSPVTVIRLGRHAATRSSRIWFVTDS